MNALRSLFGNTFLPSQDTAVLGSSVRMSRRLVTLGALAKDELDRVAVQVLHSGVEAATVTISGPGGTAW